MKTGTKIVVVLALCAVALGMLAATADAKPAKIDHNPSCVTKHEFSELKRGMKQGVVALVVGGNGKSGQRGKFHDWYFKGCAPYNQITTALVEFENGHLRYKVVDWIKNIHIKPVHTKVSKGTVYYATCAKAPGPIRKGQPGYRKALDKNHDGVACQ